MTFADLPLIDPADVERILLRIARRILRYIETRREEYVDDEEDIERACIAQSHSRAVAAGQFSHRNRNASDADQSSTQNAPLYCASIDGFSLHANVTLRAGDKKALRRLIRYGARQAFAEDRLSLTDDGRVCYKLTRPWGPKRRTSLTFEPKDFLHRLAALIPAPYLHLTRYSGIFAPNAHRRWEISAAGMRARQKRRTAQKDDPELVLPIEIPEPMPRSIPWAELLARTFSTDVQRCEKCDGRMAIIAFITEQLIVRKILEHLRLPTGIVPPAPIIRRTQLDIDFAAPTIASHPPHVGNHLPRGPPA
jgi:hypothetical protein